MLRYKLTRRGVLKLGLGSAFFTLNSLGQGREAIRIGLVDPFSGVYAALGRSELEGARMAVDDVNVRGGVLGRPLELLPEDSAAKTDVGVQKLRKLVERERV